MNKFTSQLLVPCLLFSGLGLAATPQSLEEAKAQRVPRPEEKATNWYEWMEIHWKGIFDTEQRKGHAQKYMGFVDLRGADEKMRDRLTEAYSDGILQQQGVELSLLKKSELPKFKEFCKRITNMTSTQNMWRKYYDPKKKCPVTSISSECYRKYAPLFARAFQCFLEPDDLRYFIDENR